MTFGSTSIACGLRPGGLSGIAKNFRRLAGGRQPPCARFLMLSVKKCAPSAGLDELAVHPHMLRHACGYDLANRGADTRLIQGYLGHRNIQHTVRCTELAPSRFKDLF